MKASTADLLFTAKVHGEDTHFYFLCEHQSREDGLMALSVLGYMVRIWTEEARGFTPDFAFRLLQFVEQPFESIAGPPDGKLALRVLKAQPMGELLEEAVWEACLLKQVSRELLESLIRYTDNEDVDKEQFWSRLKGLPRADLNPETMTLADKFREEGRQEGRELGRLDGAFQMVCDVLEVRFGVVPAGLREVLGHIQEVSRLRELHGHAIRCSGLEEFASLL